MISSSLLWECPVCGTKSVDPEKHWKHLLQSAKCMKKLGLQVPATSTSSSEAPTDSTTITQK